MAAPTNDERSLFTLIGELPDTVSTLVRAEIDQIKAEISATRSSTSASAQASPRAPRSSAIFLLFTLIVAAIFALALVMPALGGRAHRVGRPAAHHRRAAVDRVRQLQARLRAARIGREPEGRPRRPEGNG